MQTIFAIMLCIGAGIVGGVFFAFSTFVMRALAQLPDAEGIAAMQRINVVVLNPLFLGVFMGSALLSAVCLVAAFFPWATPQSPLLIAGGAVYLAGSFFVTMRGNVPMNERLAQVDAKAPEASEYWPIYVRTWSMWNHVRTLASLASATFGAVFLAA